MNEAEREADRIRTLACRRVIVACAKSDLWNMRRFAAINSYFYRLTAGSQDSPLSDRLRFKQIGRVFDSVIDENFSVEFITRPEN